MSIEEFIKEQTQQYQRHLSIKYQTCKVLQYQQNIRTHKTIPKQYLPPNSLQLTLPNTTLTADYQQKSQDLFFQHLDDVITHNTITLELQEAQMRQIVLRTEKQLATMTTRSTTTAQYYKQQH